MTSLVVGSVLCVVALVLVASGGFALWKDRTDRDGQGFVTFGSEELRTGQYAIVGDLRGDGPEWLYGSDVLGDVRVRATSHAERPLFMGVARKDDVLRYLEGVGYATIYSFEVTADTTHPGDAPADPPGRESIWAESTQGVGQQTLRWTPRSGDWSVVLMNADAGADVDVRGDAGAELPVLPWLAGGLLVTGAALGLLGGWLLVGATRRPAAPAQAVPETARESTPGGGPGSARRGADATTGEEKTMDRYRSLLERYIERYNAGDLDGVMDLYAEDSVQLMPDGTFEGRSSIRDRLGQELAAFSDVAHRYISYVEDEDAFADEWVFVGTHTGPVVLPGGTEVPPTGKRVEVQGMELVQVRDGKIVVDNLYYDNLAVAAQLGLLPQQDPTTV